MFVLGGIFEERVQNLIDNKDICTMHFCNKNICTSSMLTFYIYKAKILRLAKNCTLMEFILIYFIFN